MRTVQMNEKTTFWQLHHYLIAKKHYLDSILSTDEQDVQR